MVKKLPIIDIKLVDFQHRMDNPIAKFKQAIHDLDSIKSQIENQTGYTLRILGERFQGAQLEENIKSYRAGKVSSVSKIYYSGMQSSVSWMIEVTLNRDKVYYLYTNCHSFGPDSVYTFTNKQDIINFLKERKILRR